MIPVDRPVTGNDLEKLRKRLGLHATVFGPMVLGLNMAQWSEYKSKENLHEPVWDPAVAILARYLMRHPERCPIKPTRSPEEVFHRVKEAYEQVGRGDKLTKKQFGVSFGREASAGYRWVVQGAEVAATHDRMFDHILGGIQPPAEREVGADEVVAVYDEFVELAEIEAHARGLKDIWHSGNWERERKGKAREAEPASVESKTKKPAAKKPAAKKAAAPKKAADKDARGAA